MLVCDMCAPGAKIVDVNPAFEALTGYARDGANGAVGRNCRLLQVRLIIYIYIYICIDIDT